jgi:superfamily II DNA or RNA helicase
MSEDQIKAIEKQLLRLDEEYKALSSELSKLRAQSSEIQLKPLLGIQLQNKAPVTNEEKIELFLKLFRCRESVYPKFWENKSKGTKGYSPVCKNEWVRSVCDKPKIKCSDCPNQAFQPLDALAIEQHLKGQSIIGTYAIRADDTCTFLACDFDESSWVADAFLYQQVGRELGIEVLIERSKSGKGAHAWIFFAQPISARLARSLGTLILAKCVDKKHSIDLDSYDRFFPNQDFIPKGGFGNLIALPLQKTAREQDNSVFINEKLNPIPDQWGFLSKVHRLTEWDIKTLLKEYLPAKTNNFEDDLSLMADQNILVKTIKTILEEPQSLLGSDLNIYRDSQIRISIENIHSRFLGTLKKLATFPNPEFYKLQRMRMSTYPHRRFIFSGELRTDEIVLPRGILDRVCEVAKKSGANVIIHDERVKGKRLTTKFIGQLSEVQEQAVNSFKKKDIGILVAPPGAGKTVMGCALIAQRKVSTLILVHRQPLLEQWKDRLTQFLDIDSKEIGIFKGSKKKAKGKIDIAMIQSLSKIEDFSDFAEKYGQVIIDECHHIPAISFEAILKQFQSKFILGLTATPKRKDGLERILYQQCGPIQHTIDSVDGSGLEKKVIFKETGLKFPEEVGPQPPYHIVAELVSTNKKRNQLIVGDILQALEIKRFPLVIADRKDQIEYLSATVRGSVSESSLQVFKLDGEMSPKVRREVVDGVLFAYENQTPVVLFATASLIGEGFDMPELDTLILATPLSFEGRMIQYAGRLHRQSKGKSNVLIHDYLDSYSAVLLKMYRNRIKAYKKMGYKIEAPITLFQ